MDLVSIIIPTYNAEKTLNECLDSCINQTHSNIEIVLINDGSTDKSLEIASEYRKKDSRIVIFDQKNKGQASARNVGLNNCKGEYVLFLDSDDWLQKDAVEILLRKISSGVAADFVLFGFNIYRQGNLLRTPNPGDYIFTYGMAFREFQPIYRLMGSPCNKFFKRKYITKYFPEDISYAEDAIFNYKNFKPGTKVICISDCLYNVRLSSGGVNARYVPNKLKNSIYCHLVEETVLTAYFSDADIEQIRKGSLSSFISVILLLASNTKFDIFKKELDKAYEDEYFKEVLKVENVAKLHQRIFKKIAISRKKRTLYLYCKLLAVLRKILKTK